jgi:tetratricopeptide (TPR) repeat protein
MTFRLNRFIAFIFLAGLTIASLAGQTDQEKLLAESYFDKGEFDKALRFYERFHRQTPENSEYFFRYTDCLREVGDEKEWLKIGRAQVKRFPDNLLFRYPLYQAIKAVEGDKKAEREFSQMLKNLPASFDEIDALGGLLIMKRELEMALRLYQTAEQQFGSIPPLTYRQMELAWMQQNHVLIAELSVQMIKKLPREFSTVQSRLSTFLDDDKSSAINVAVKDALKKEVQRNTEQAQFADLLLWVYLQERDFSSAFSLAKSLDKRFREDGQRVIDLARICRENKEYRIAEQAYRYIIALGQDAMHYQGARIGLLELMEERLRSLPFISPESISAMDSNYQATLDFLGPFPQANVIKVRYARFLGFQMRKVKAGIDLIENLLATASLTAGQKAEAQMELADLMILSGEMWEPTLLYGSVEKSFPYDVLGQEAKFRNARLCYFRGEVAWAHTQVKVLKTATSKLIANDAMAMSLLIGDFGGPDSASSALQSYARAELHVFRNSFDKALHELSQLHKNHGLHPIIAISLELKGDIYQRMGQPEEAIGFYRQALKHPEMGVFADRVWYKLAELFRMNGRSDEAKEAYQTIIVEYPGSIYAAEARTIYRELRGEKGVAP